MEEISKNNTIAQEDIPIPNTEFEEYLKQSARKEQLYSIGFFDILGFSNLVENSKTNAIMDLYQKLLDLLDQQQSSKEGESCITGVVPVPTSPDCKHSFYIAQGNGFVNVIHFSDTFIIYVNYDIKAPSILLRDSKYEPFPFLQNEIGAAIPENFIRNHNIFNSFLQTCMEFFCNAIIKGIPLRGCISTGMATMDKYRNIYIGKPLVEAAKGEPERSSIGITYGKSFCRYHSIYNDYHIPYLANIKNDYPSSKFLSPMAVDWPRYWRSRSDFNKFDIKECIDKMNENPSFSKYYDNAVAFSDYSKKHNNWAHEINRENLTDIFDFYSRCEQWYESVN